MGYEPGRLRGRTVLITGGLGFIGSNLAHRLVELGAKVTIVDALLPLYGGNLTNIGEIQDRVTLYRADIRDARSIEGLVSGQEFIFNLAAQVSYITSDEDPVLDLDINCRGHLNLLEACRRVNRDARILFPGTRMQYGRIETVPVPESHPMNPLGIYGIHKLTGENYYRMYHRTHGLKTTVLRIANPYGIRHQMKHSKYGILNWFVRLAMDGQRIRIFGTGDQVRDYVYVGDVVEAFLAAALHPAAVGESFNVGSGTGTPFVDMARTVVEVVGAGELEMVPWPKDYFHIETGDYVLDISKMTRLLGWKPGVSLAEGVRLTHGFYVRHRDRYWERS
jgi:UDP-glucose 4-epimerase